MSATLISAPGAIRRYIALSSDTKPVSTTTDRVSAGSELYELDTGDLYVNDGTSWRVKDRAAPSTAVGAVQVSEAIYETNRLLRKLIAGLELYLGSEFPEAE